jgi:hypothetical protein
LDVLDPNLVNIGIFCIPYMVWNEIRNCGINCQANI